MTNYFAKNPSSRCVTMQAFIFIVAAPSYSMVEFSQNELKAIAAHPVRKGLETFRTTFASRYFRSENADVTEVIDRLTSEAFDRGEWITYGVTRLLIQDRRKGCHTRSYPGTSSSASCSDHSLTDWG